MLDSDRLKDVLAAVGELLDAESTSAYIVVVGGASLNLLGLIQRTTGDVDVIAQADPTEDGGPSLRPPDPLPDPLQRAAQTVARDFGLSSDWLNTVVGSQWKTGLPPEMDTDLTWLSFGGLHVGLAQRRSLIALKLYASVDQGPRSVHVQDLVALRPTSEELATAAQWVEKQDASPAFTSMIEEVISHVERRIS